MTTTSDILRSTHSPVYIGPKYFAAKDEDGLERSFVLIEGDASALRFLGNLLLAMAEPQEACSLDLHPVSAGARHFASGSQLGFMLHRTDCEHGSKR